LEENFRRGININENGKGDKEEERVEEDKKN
jgi:hypothetical protein